MTRKQKIEELKRQIIELQSQIFMVIEQRELIEGAVVENQKMVCEVSNSIGEKRYFLEKMRAELALLGEQVGESKTVRHKDGTVTVEKGQVQKDLPFGK